VLRCSADRNADQGPSPTFDAAAVRHVRTVTGCAELAVDVLVTTGPDRLARVWTHIGHPRTPELDVVLGGVRFAGFPHDWRDAGPTPCGARSPQRPARGRTGRSPTPSAPPLRVPARA
jgi:hypothetical protein